MRRATSMVWYVGAAAIGILLGHLIARYGWHLAVWTRDILREGTTWGL